MSEDLKPLKTHRCENLIKSKLSIRFCQPSIKKQPFGWYLVKANKDGNKKYSLIPVAKIDYCPFCGEKLNVKLVNVFYINKMNEIVPAKIINDDGDSFLIVEPNGVIKLPQNEIYYTKANAENVIKNK